MTIKRQPMGCSKGRCGLDWAAFKWPPITSACSCVIMMLVNQHPNMPHLCLSGGLIISLKKKYSTTCVTSNLSNTMGERWEQKKSCIYFCLKLDVYIRSSKFSMPMSFKLIALLFRQLITSSGLFPQTLKALSNPYSDIQQPPLAKS